MIHRGFRRFTALGLLLITGCESGVSLAAPGVAGADQSLHPSLAKSQDPRRASAEDIFRGIFLVDGPVLAMVPQLRRGGGVETNITDPAIRQEVRRFHSRVIAQIKSDNPTFFQHFGADMKSGNPVRVEHALRNAGSALQQGIVRIPEVAAARESLKQNPEQRRELAAALQARLSGIATPLAGAVEARSEGTATDTEITIAGAGGDVELSAEMLVAALLDDQEIPDPALAIFLGPTWLVLAVNVVLIAWSMVAAAHNVALAVNVYGAVMYQQYLAVQTNVWAQVHTYVDYPTPPYTWVGPIECVWPDGTPYPCHVQPFSHGSVPGEQMIYQLTSLFEG